MRQSGSGVRQPLRQWADTAISPLDCFLFPSDQSTSPLPLLFAFSSRDFLKNQKIGKGGIGKETRYNAHLQRIPLIFPAQKKGGRAKKEGDRKGKERENALHHSLECGRVVE